MSSYAQNIKINRLGLTREQIDRAFDLMGASESYWDHLNWVIDDFTREQDYRYTIGTNGRSGGYLVLYRSKREPTGHKSYCPCCGQPNFAAVATLPNDPAHAAIAREVIKFSGWRDETYLDQEAVKRVAMSDAEKLRLVRRFKAEYRGSTLGNRCGACGAEGDRGRLNFTQPPMRLSVDSRGIDENEDFDSDKWSIGALRDRTRLVQAFDHACDRIRAAFIDLLDNCSVEEEEVVITKTIKVIRCA